jgi:peptide/nickel transport system permease protein
MSQVAAPITRQDARVAPGRHAVRSILSFLRAIARNPAGLVGFVIIVAYVIVAFIGPYVVPLDTTTRVDQIYQLPSAEHLLGTDYEGRDILSQIVNGGRDVLIVAFLAAALSTFIAVFFGSLSAFVGGTVDGLISGITDIWLTIPQVPLLAVLAAFIRLNNAWMLSVIIGLLAWPTLLRAVRAQVLSLKQRDYIEAARALDLGTGHIIFREIMPNMMSYIAISFTLGMTSAMYAQLGLIFLGLVPLSGHNWAVMLNLGWTKGAIFFKGAMSYILSPVFVIALFQLALVMFSRSLEEVFNPRLRTGF